MQSVRAQVRGVVRIAGSREVKWVLARSENEEVGDLAFETLSVRAGGDAERRENKRCQQRAE